VEAVLALLAIASESAFGLLELAGSFAIWACQRDDATATKKVAKKKG
jgi:hypothetical protein